MKIFVNYLRYYTSLLIIFVLMSFWGCKEDPSSSEDPVNYKFGNGIIVLNEGSYGLNNASVTYKSFENDSLYQDVYSTANGGTALGDVANHITINDGKAYIVLYNSNKIEVAGLDNFKTIQTIPLGTGSQPRSIALYDGFAYVTSYNGYVYKITLSNGSIADSIKVGSKPEGIIEANAKLFVANSGWGSDSTVSVIDPSTGSIIKTIIVGINPQLAIKGNDGYVYVVGGGSYSDPAAKSGLWKIDPQTLSVIDFIEIPGNPGKICNYINNTLLVANSEGVLVINPSTKSKNLAIPLNEINSSGGGYAMIYALSYDAESGEIYCGNPKDYTQSGEVVIFKEESGTFIKKYTFDCGLNPNWIIVVRKNR